MKAIIDANEFKRLVDNTKKFVRDYGLMAWIYLEIEENTIKATALDGHRVSIEYAIVKDLDEPFKCFIKPEIPKITKRDIDVELTLSDKKAYITVGENIRGYKQPEGEFFNVKSLVDDLKAKEPLITIGADAKLLKDAFDSVKVNGAAKPYVRIDIHGKKEPIVIRRENIGMEGVAKENIKLVLPVNMKD